jgi:hypothetical protein
MESIIYPQFNSFTHTMRALFADERGRITLGAKLLGKFGRKFAVVAGINEIVLVPIAKDPLAKLQELGKKAGLDKYSIKELRKIALQEAQKDARRH